MGLLSLQDYCVNSVIKNIILLSGITTNDDFIIDPKNILAVKSSLPMTGKIMITQDMIQHIKRKIIDESYQIKKIYKKKEYFSDRFDKDKLSEELSKKSLEYINNIIVKYVPIFRQIEYTFILTDIFFTRATELKDTFNDRYKNFLKSMLVELYNSHEVSYECGYKDNLEYHYYNIFDEDISEEIKRIEDFEKYEEKYWEQDNEYV